MFLELTENDGAKISVNLKKVYTFSHVVDSSFPLCNTKIDFNNYFLFVREGYEDIQKTIGQFYKP